MLWDSADPESTTARVRAKALVVVVGGIVGAAYDTTPSFVVLTSLIAVPAAAHRRPITHQEANASPALAA
jgi:hypothetical protein